MWARAEEAQVHDNYTVKLFQITYQGL